MSAIIMGGSAQIAGNIDVSYRQDNLIAGDLQLVTQNITLKTDQGILQRGTVLSKDETGVYVISKLTSATNNDGTTSTTTPSSIVVLADTYNTTNGDVTAGAYFTGEFNANRIIIDDSWTLDALRDASRPFTIFFKDVVNADNPT
ncbi:head decoration protein [Commensalibacter papalotli (ex Botero et al. 2024)]|uniref:head decoration protein n=1 Tax=Commensalibacter papalotli (ex Botero et al. 2024) TaxID=2972766 RepID=UPI0022FFB2A9|nr:head decoration protein [Commensalibacter papalotli (ex Botero et al. 2024)]CAI3945418.1 unnamed protein product [Commensalibacter papalotli (ex Botero et al. 2024)]